MSSSRKYAFYTHMLEYQDLKTMFQQYTCDSIIILLLSNFRKHVLYAAP